MANIYKKSAIKLTNFAQMKFSPTHAHPNKISLDVFMRMEEQSPLILNYSRPKIPKDILRSLLEKQKKLLLQPGALPITQSLKQIPQNDQQNLIERSTNELNSFRQQNPQQTFHSISYIYRLSQKIFLIGNENQVDAIQSNKSQIQGQSGIFLFTQFYWSLNSQNSPIRSLAITKQISSQDRLICKAQKKKVVIYSLPTKSLTELPKKIFELKFSQQIMKVDFIKKHFLLVYFIDSFQIYQIGQPSGKFEVNLVLHQKYDLGPNQQHELFDISQVSDSSFKIFFIINNCGGGNAMFRLSSIQVYFNSAYTFTVSPLKKIYDINCGYKHLLKIHNYSRQIVLINVGHQIIAIKNGLVIDNATVNIKDNLYFLNYFPSKHTITHIQNDRIQEYYFQISKKFNPQKIIINPKDSIQYSKPQNTIIFKIIEDEFGYNLFLREKNEGICSVKQKNGIINYCFCMSFEVSVFQKLQQIFPDAQTIEKISQIQLTFICDTATKLGLSQKQAYFEIWNKSYKNTAKSYRILLMTYDVELILSQIQAMTRKNIKYRNIVKIIHSCIEFLRNQILSSNCSESKLLDFMKCNFLMLKLETFKDFELFRKKIENGQFANQNIAMKLITGNFKEIISMNRTYRPTLRNNSETNDQLPTLRKISATMASLPAIPEKSQEEQKIKTSDLVVGIKAYKFYNQTNIKSIFLSELGQFAYNQKNAHPIIVIRYFIKNFRILYRIIYEQLMIKVLKQHKFHMLEILKNFPQFLPVEDANLNDEELKTIWMPFTSKDFAHNVFLPELQTIDNKETIKSIRNNIEIKRNIYTYHGLICENSTKTLQMCNFSQKQRFFFLFYEEMFQERNHLQKTKLRISQTTLKKDVQTGLKKQEIQDRQNKIIKILAEVSRKYPLIPQSLKYFSQIYYELYFGIGRQEPQIQSYHLIDFIKLSNHQLFKLYIQKQKNTKGYILDKIYTLYETKLEHGRKIFRKGLTEYFNEQKDTAISDLKIILNRFNSKGGDYQMRNEKLFVVLVDCLTQVVRIRKGSKIDLEKELLVYVKDVSFGKSNTALIQKLRYLNRINMELKLLQEVNIDMTIEEIERNGEQTLFRILCHMIKRWGIKQIDLKNTKYHYFKSFSYLVCSHANSFRAHIYFGKHQQFLLFVYVTEIMKEEHLVPLVFQLLDDPYIKEFFNVNEHFKQCVFFYMLSWRFSFECANYKFSNHNPEHKSLEWFKAENAIFFNHKEYIAQILELVDEETQTLDRKFLQLEIQYAQEMQKLGCILTYPISQNFTIPTLAEIKAHLEGCSMIQKVDSIFISNIFDILNRMRNICEPKVQENLEIKMIWFTKELYDIVLFQLIRKNLLIEAVKIVQSMLQFGEYDDSIVLYPILIIQPILNFLPEKNKINVTELVSYFFYKPRELIEIIKKIFREKMTMNELEAYLKDQVQSAKKQGCKMYAKDNFLFKKKFLQKLNSIDQTSPEKDAFERILNNTLIHLTASKQDFRKNKIYRILFKIMCHSPYLAAKFISSQTSSFNIKIFRAFISFMAQEVVFHSENVLKLGICIHEMLLYRITTNTTIQEIVKSYQESPTPIPKEFDFPKNHQLRETDLTLANSLKLMNQKLKFYLQNNLSQKIKQGYLKIHRGYQIKETLSKAKLLKRKLRLKNWLKKVDKLLSEKDDVFMVNCMIAYALFALDPFEVEQRLKAQSKISWKIGIGSQKSLGSGMLDMKQYEDIQKYKKLSFDNVQQVFKDPDIITEMIPSLYFFRNDNDKDDGYELVREDEITWFANIVFPVNLPFDEATKRHEILQTQGNKRFDSTKIKKERKYSVYFQHSFNSKQKSDGLVLINQLANQFLSASVASIKNNHIHLGGEESLKSFGQKPEEFNGFNTVFSSYLGTKAKESNPDDSVFNSLLGSKTKELPALERSQSAGPHWSLKNSNLRYTQTGKVQNLSVGISKKMRKKESLHVDLSLMMQINPSKLSIQKDIMNQNDSVLERQLKIICIKMSNKSLFQPEEIRQNILESVNPNYDDTHFLKQLKNALQTVYECEAIDIDVRLALLEIVLVDAKIDDYVSEYLDFYRRATDVPFIKDLMRKFSVIFKFDGLFYSRRVHGEKQRKQRQLQGILQKSKPIEVQTGPQGKLNMQNQQQLKELTEKQTKNENFPGQGHKSLQEILYIFLKEDLHINLSMASITQMALIIEKCLSDHAYYKRVYFELMVSTAEDLCDKRVETTLKKGNAKKDLIDEGVGSEEYLMIKQLIQDLDDEAFMNQALRQIAPVKSEEKLIIGEILSEVMKEKGLD